MQILINTRNFCRLINNNLSIIHYIFRFLAQVWALLNYEFLCSQCSMVFSVLVYNSSQWFANCSLMRLYRAGAGWYRPGAQILMVRSERGLATRQTWQTCGIIPDRLGWDKKFRAGSTQNTHSVQVHGERKCQ